MTLLNLASEAEYRSYYNANFCARPLRMRIGALEIDVFFDRSKFDHAFFESSQRNGVKDLFSTPRATHMNLIPQMLQDSGGDRRAGWDSKRRAYDQGHCVAIAAGNFIVVVRLSRSRTGVFRARFVTCYVADASISKILQSPKWDFTEAQKLI